MIPKAFLALAVIALASLACSFNIDLPITDVKTGPTETLEINIPNLAVGIGTAEVTLDFGAGKLNLASGADDVLVAGTAEFNVDDFRPEISIEDESIHIEQGNLNLDGIPNFSTEIVNRWDLAFGTALLDLTINAGAYQGDFELGGLSLERLVINDGAADVDVSFSELNLVEMSLLEYTTGASNVSLEGLANANCTELIIHSGAGFYRLDFSGELSRDMNVRIESGVSQVTVIVPEGTSVVLTNEGSLMNVSTRGAWEKDGDRYEVSGEGFTITILVDMGAGNLSLETR